MTRTNPYEALKIAPDATREEVIRTYDRLARLHSPAKHPGDPLAEHMFAFVTEAFHRIMLERHEAEKNRGYQLVPLDDPATSLLRFDGLYSSPVGAGNSYIRFYPDRTVLVVTSTANPVEVAQWFNKGHEWSSIGDYAIKGRQINFVTHSTLGAVNYEGEMEDSGLLRLSWHSYINGKSGHSIYSFVDPQMASEPHEEPPQIGTPAQQFIPTPPAQKPPDLAAMRTEVWRTLAWTLGTLAVLTIISFIIVSAHVREATAVGLVLTLVIIVGLWILYANVTELISAWGSYRSAQHHVDHGS